MDCVTMFLCETEHLYLKPNVQYVFEVDENCERCRELASLSES